MDTDDKAVFPIQGIAKIKDIYVCDGKVLPE